MQTLDTPPIPKPTSTRITKEQWMVLTAAFLGWLFDGF